MLHYYLLYIPQHIFNIAYKLKSMVFKLFCREWLLAETEIVYFLFLAQKGYIWRKRSILFWRKRVTRLRYCKLWDKFKFGFKSSRVLFSSLLDGAYIYKIVDLYILVGIFYAHIILYSSIGCIYGNKFHKNRYVKQSLAIVSYLFPTRALLYYTLPTYLLL